MKNLKANIRGIIYENHTKFIDNGALTISDVANDVGVPSFRIRTEGDGYRVKWYTTRPETDKEMAERIERATKYKESKND
jgi:hypothetical protein